MRALHIAALALLLISIVACAQEQPPEPMQPAPGRAPVNEAVPPSSAATKQVAQNGSPGILAQPNSGTQKLFANSGSVKSYSFDIVYLPDAGAKHTYYVKGNRAKVVLNEPLLFPDKFNADAVYLDLEQKTAYAHCSKGKAYCDDPTVAKPVSYTDYEIILPQDWIRTLKYGTRTKSLTFFNVPVNVVELEQDGKHYQAYVHNFYGIPVRVAIANDKEMTQIVGGYEYRSMAFNKVTDADVTEPQ